MGKKNRAMFGINPKAIARNAKEKFFTPAKIFKHAQEEVKTKKK